MAALSLGAAPSFASTFGTLSNFDVVNDTPHPCHGFEIELEDIHTRDVPYTFGGTYIRYGAPEVLDATTDPAHPRVIVRYRRWNGSEWEATPVAPANVTPSGHDCYEGGPVGNYQTSGCEHYGVSLTASPTRTTYRWLVAADPSDPSTAFSNVPQPVQIPVPVWSVAPIPADAGGGLNVQAEIEPLEEENHVQRGEPQWIKVYKIETDLDLVPEDLNRLLLGVAGGIVPPETEIETEWKMIQSKPGNAEGEEEDADVREDPLDDGMHSVVRRYEFYRYIGPRDPENNEALPCIADDEPVPADAPLDGCADLGEFVGAQNVAVDLALGLVASPLPAGEVGVEVALELITGGIPPYVVSVTGGVPPDGLAVDPVTGILGGTPATAGEFSFTVRVEDAVGDSAEGALAMSIAAAPTPTPVPDTPTPEPTATLPPTATETAAPADTPTAEPTATVPPTATETAAPADTPTAEPTATAPPTATDTAVPADTPTQEPTATATAEATSTATVEPSATPADTETPLPTHTEPPAPTPTPTAAGEPTATRPARQRLHGAGRISAAGPGFVVVGRVRLEIDESTMVRLHGVTAIRTGYLARYIAVPNPDGGLTAASIRVWQDQRDEHGRREGAGGPAARLARARTQRGL